MKTGRPTKVTYDEILEFALELFYERGFQGVSMKDLEVHCGIAKPSIYQKFSSKEHLFELVLTEYVDRYIENLESLKKDCHRLEDFKNLLLSQSLILQKSRNSIGCLLAHSSNLSGPNPESKKLKNITHKQHQKLINYYSDSFFSYGLKSKLSSELALRLHATILGNATLIRSGVHIDDNLHIEGI